MLRVRGVSLNISFGLLLLVCRFICMVNAQSSSCSLITVGELGNTTHFSALGLVPLSLDNDGEGRTVVQVRINRYHVVCNASGDRRDTSSFVSILVEFQCMITGGGTVPNQPTCDGSTMNTRQFQFSCGPSTVWASIVGGTTNFVQTVNPTATFETPPDNQCRRCIDDQQSTRADPTTHCESCRVSCTGGLERCYIGTGDQCCNFYSNGVCITTCNSPLEKDSTFECVCPEINLENGRVTYSPINRANESVATHTCNFGYRLLPEGGVIRNCNISDRGWDGENFTCEAVDNVGCPIIVLSHGEAVITPPNPVASLSCNVGYKLRGDNTRTCQSNGTWSGSEPQCDLDIVTISVVLAVTVFIMGLAITTIVILALVFIRVKKQAAVPQHIYDDINPQLPQELHQHQNKTIMHTTDGRLQNSAEIALSSTSASEGGAAESISPYAATEVVAI